MGKGSNTTTTQQNQTYTPTGQPQIQAALTQAQNAAQLPFNIPQAPVAGFSQDQLSAFQNVNNAQGMAQPYINQANNYFQQSAQRPDVSQFFNPMVGAVSNQLQNIFGQQASQNTGQLTQAAGGIGADRIAVGQGNLANQQGLAAGQTFAGLYAQAQQAAQQQQSMLQSAGYGTAALGSQAQNAALTGAQAQLGTGGLQQQLAQAQLNAPYQQQLARAAFPYQQAQFNAGITGALAPGLGGTTAGFGQTTAPAPSLFSQILGLGTAGVGAAGSLGAFGGPSATDQYGGGSAAAGDAYGGSRSAPLNGLTAADYGKGAGGRVPMFAEGGAPSDEPIDVSHLGIIPQEKLPAAQVHMPSLNLNPPAASGKSGSGDVGAIVGDVAKIAGMFLKRGGMVNPRFAEGGDTLSDADQAAMMPETFANPLVDKKLRGMANVMMMPGRALQSETPMTSEDMIAPANQLAGMAMQGSGAMPAEGFRSGMSIFPKGYHEKVPMDQRMSLKGVSHPGFRWQVIDKHTGKIERKDIASRGQASRSADRLDNKYGGYRYQAEPVRASEGQLTEDELKFLKDNDIGFKRGGMVNPKFADGGSPLDDEQWPVGPIGGPTDEARGSDILRNAMLHHGYQPNGFNDRYPAVTSIGPVDAIGGASPQTASAYPSGSPFNPYRMISPETVTADASKGEALPPGATSTEGTLPPPSRGAAQGSPGEGGPSRPSLAPPHNDPEAPAEEDTSSKFAKSPWLALMAAGLGIAGGTSPFAGVNIGQGGLMGVKALEQQREAAQKDTTIEQAARRLELEAQHQQFEMGKPVPIGQTIGPLGLPMTTYAVRQPDGSYKPVQAPVPTTKDEANNPVQNIVDGIKSGQMPPDTTGLYRMGFPVKAALAKDKFDLAQAQLDWAAAKKQILSLNGPQMVRYVGLAKGVDQTIDRVRELSTQMQQSGVPLLNQLELQKFIQTEGNTPRGQLATAYQTQVGILKEEFANLANGGYAPTEPAWALANQQINGNYGVKQLGASLDEVQRAIRYRLHNIPNMDTLGPGTQNRYVPGGQQPAAQAPAPGATPAPGGKAPIVYQNGHAFHLQPDGTYK